MSLLLWIMFIHLLETKVRVIHIQQTEVIKTKEARITLISADKDRTFLEIMLIELFISQALDRLKNTPIRQYGKRNISKYLTQLLFPLFLSFCIFSFQTVKVI
jgi:hypothetical protein